MRISFRTAYVLSSAIYFCLLCSLPAAATSAGQIHRNAALSTVVEQELGQGRHIVSRAANATGTPSSVPQPTAAAVVSVTIPITGYYPALHYNHDSGLLYIVDSDEQLTVVNGATVTKRLALADGSDSCLYIGCVRFRDVPGTGRTYVAVWDTDTTDQIVTMDGANLVQKLTLPRVMDLTWSPHDGNLYMGSDTLRPGYYAQHSVVLQDTQVITSIPMSTPESDTRFGPHGVSSSGLAYRAQDWEVVALDATGIKQRINLSHYAAPYRENVAVNAVSGKAYVTGTWRDYSLGINRPVVTIIDGLQVSRIVTFTEGTREGAIVGVVSDPYSASVYVGISRCSEGNCQYEIVEFVGDEIQTRLAVPTGVWKMQMHPVTGELYAIANYWPNSAVAVIRHGAILAQLTPFPAVNYGAFSELAFAPASDWSLLVTRADYDRSARYYLYHDKMLQGILTLPDVPMDVELTDAGVWISMHCPTYTACGENKSTAYYYSYTYFQEHGLWVNGRVVDESNTAQQAWLTLTRAGTAAPLDTFPTDSAGRFSIVGLEPGSYTIKAVPQNGPGDQVAVEYVTVPPNSADLTLVVKTPSGTTEPVIFIPGVAGTFLKDGSQELWPALGMPWRKDKLSLAPGQTNTSVQGTAPMQKIAVPVLSDESIYDVLYQAFSAQYTLYAYDESNPAQLPGYGCNLQQGGGIPTFFPFPYDWRKDIAGELAPRLANYIDTCVRQFHPNAKINIVAHSMGGLVARQYILQQPQHSIGKVITIGTPWLGAPKAINALFTGKFLSWLQHRLIISENSLQELLEYYPGAHQLFPSKTFYDEMGEQPLALTTDTGLDCQHGSLFPLSRSLTFEEAMTWLNCRYPGSKPSNAINALHTTAQDDWRAANSTGVKYYIIYGQTEKDETIKSISRLELRTCVANVCAPITWTNVSVTAGDGTVPLVSATRRGNNKDLNGSEAVVCRAPGPQQEHGDMTRSTAVLSLVLGLLHGDESGCASMQTAAAQSQSAYYLTVNGAALPQIADSQGNTGGGVDSGPAPYANLPGVNLQELDTAAYLLVLPKDQIYTVTLPLTTTAVLLNIAEGTGSQTNRSITYRDLNVTQGQDLRLQFSPSAVSALALDANGDGAFETTLPPAAEVSGPQASDTTPPLVTIEAKKEGAGYKVTITAQDASGVAAIRYTQDGQIYQAYTGSFDVGAVSDMTITAFADDVAGNRSPTVSYTVRAGAKGPELYLPLLRR